MPLIFRQKFAYTCAAWWPALSMEVLTFLLMLGIWKRQGECQVGWCRLGTNFQVMQGYHVCVRTLNVSLMARWVCVELKGCWGGILGAQMMLRLCQFSMTNINSKCIFWWWKSFCSLCPLNAWFFVGYTSNQGSSILAVFYFHQSFWDDFRNESQF